MSDVSVPGVKSKYGTEDTIKKLMELEARPKVRAEAELKAMEQRSSVWQDVNVKMTKLRDVSRTLFSYNNPFSERIGKSSNDDVLTATATREAVEETRSILVKEIALADRFLSKPLSPDYKVPAGEYAFSVGKKNVNFRFQGGSAKDFVEALNRSGKDVIRAQVIAVEKGKNSILVESLLTGSSNRLSFKGAAESFALSSGMLERVPASERALPLDPASAHSIGKAPGPSTAKLSEGALSVPAGTELSIPLSPAAKDGKGLILEFEYKTIVHPDDYAAPKAPPGPDIPPTGKIEYKGIQVFSAPLDVPLPPWLPPPVPKRVDDLSMLSLGLRNGTEKALAPQADNADYARVAVPLSGLGSDLSSFNIRNKNTHRDILVRNARVYDPAETGGFKPSNALSTGRDAVIVLDGVEVRRESNDISDLIPGVTLNLHEKSDKAVKLSIEPDREASKEAIVNWIFNYNQLMRDINVLTSNNESVISEMEGLSDAEKEAARKRLGLLQGDFTLNNVKSQLQRISMNPYPTQAGNELSLLHQMGISTNASSGGAGYDPARLRGYLEVDERKLDAALAGKMAAVKQLFGNDVDGDLIIDAGAGFAMDALMKPYVELGGINAQKRQTIASQIDRQKKTIQTMQEQLARKEAELKRKYGMMEGALNQMEKTSNSLDNFNKRDD